MKKIAVFLWCLTAVAATQAQETPKPQPAAKPGAAAQEKPAPAANAAAKPDPAKEALIRKLFEMQGMKNNLQQIIASMTDNMRPMLTNALPPGEYREKLIVLFIERFQSKFKVDQVLELAVPIYDKYFSKEDVEGLIRFYETPLGRKAAAVLPKVTAESQTAGMKMGEQLGKESMAEVLDEHPELKKALEDAAAATNR